MAAAVHSAGNLFSDHTVYRYMGRPMNAADGIRHVHAGSVYMSFAQDWVHKNIVTCRPILSSLAPHLQQLSLGLPPLSSWASTTPTTHPASYTWMVRFPPHLPGPSAELGIADASHHSNYHMSITVLPLYS